MLKTIKVYSQKTHEFSLRTSLRSNNTIRTVITLLKVKDSQGKNLKFSLIGLSLNDVDIISHTKEISSIFNLWTKDIQSWKYTQALQVFLTHLGRCF